MSIFHARTFRFLRVVFFVPIHSECCTNRVSHLLRRFAGHSHWQNVRHIKEAKDKERARVTSYFLLQVDSAVKGSGGVRDPKLNSKLASVIAEAKSKNVPMDTINRRLSAQDAVEPYVIEIQAPGGVFALIETRCKSAKSTRDKVQGIAKKYGFKVSKSAPGSIANEFFEHCGIISALNQKNLDNMDAATEMAIMCGAKDVKESEIDDGVKGFEFHCEVDDIDDVRRSLESNGINIYEAYSPYLAVRKVSVSSDNYRLISEMYERLREAIDYADNFYDNCERIE